MRGLIALLCALVLAGCTRPPAIQQQESYVFGTRVEVLVVDPDPQKGRSAAAAVLREFDRLHRAYHAWQPSELTALNDAIAAGRPHRVSPEMAGLIREAQDLARRGDYLFDPGIGRLIALWGFQSDEFKAELPPPDAIQAWLKAHPSIADLTVQDDTVTSRNRQVALDFGGYLKGVALDRAAAILKGQGVHNALINIGGNILALGDKAGRKWKVGIQHPRQPGPLATLELNDGEAIGTSGDYQRYFEVGGRRYPHLLDPRTGYPATHTQAVTVLIPGGADAGTRSDASSKPVFIAGPETWRGEARKLGIEAVLRVDADGSVSVTEALGRRLEFVSPRPPLHVLP
ncbi:MAG: FAD:protein transferase [Rhodocyclaceae bacterium]|nr:FAD:protein transferase [Rhodocyclaceae bacterium]